MWSELVAFVLSVSCVAAMARYLWRNTPNDGSSRRRLEEQPLLSDHSRSSPTEQEQTSTTTANHDHQPSIDVKSAAAEVVRLREMTSLKNEYFAVRHGESEANVAALVSSDNIAARNQHGLTMKGRMDAENAGKKIKSLISDHSNGNGATISPPNNGTTITETIVVHSPFLRTKQTAEIIAKVIDADALVSEDLLRERSFGRFEGQHSHSSYDQVWAQDAVNGCLENEFDCEDVYSVSQRAAEVILKCEKMSPDGKCRFIIVSHGDILQILRATLIRNFDQKHHRQGEHLHPGQVISLTLS